MSHLKLTGKVALVTGSSSGIGAGIAIEFAREGALVTLTGRNEEKLKKIAEICIKVSPKGHKPLTVIGDITQEKVRETLITQTLKTFGKIDILVNNAGIAIILPIEQNDGTKSLDSLLDVHVRAPYHLTKLAMDQLIKNEGNVINISSILSMRPCIQVPHMEYGMAKAAMDQFTKWLARELGPKGVRANSINPGAIKTNIYAGMFGKSAEETEQVMESLGDKHALQRIGNPEEIGRVAVFLASKDSSFVTGAIVPADGGVLVMPTGSLLQ